MEEGGGERTETGSDSSRRSPHLSRNQRRIERVARRRFRTRLLSNIVVFVALFVMILVVSASLPGGMVWETVETSPAHFDHLHLLGDRLIVTDDDCEVGVYDVSDVRPVNLRFFTTGCLGQMDVAFSDPTPLGVVYLLVAHDARFWTYDVGSADLLDNFLRQGTIITNVTPWDMDRLGTTVFIAGADAYDNVNPRGIVAAVDVSNPQTPVPMWEFQTTTPVMAMVSEDGLLYLVTAGGDFDVWNPLPSGPQLVHRLHVRDAPPDGSWALAGLDVLGAFALLSAGAAGVVLVDVSSSPTVVQTVPVSVVRHGVHLTETRAYAALNLGGTPLTGDRGVAEFPRNADGTLGEPLILQWPGRGWAWDLAVDPTETRMYSSGEGFVVAARTPISLLASSSTLQASLLLGASIGAAVVTAATLRRLRPPG